MDSIEVTSVVCCFCRRTELLSQTWVDGLHPSAEEEQALSGEYGTLCRWLTWLRVLFVRLSASFRKHVSFRAINCSPTQETSEIWLQKFHTDDVALQRSVWCLWLVVFRARVTTNPIHTLIFVESYVISMEIFGLNLRQSEERRLFIEAINNYVCICPRKFPLLKSW